MPQLTVRDVDETLHQALKQEADRNGQSVNKYILRILHSALNMTPSDLAQNREYKDLDHLAGTWTEADAQEFETNLQNQRQIDSEMWQ